MRTYIPKRKKFISASAQCDNSGFIVMHKDLVKQMEYSGSGLYWTGYLVYKDFYDKPNPQNLAPRLYGDPKTVDNPRTTKNMGGLD